MDLVSTRSPKVTGNPGFSLLEMMVVVAMILIIASITIPHLLRSKMAANEASAIVRLESLVQLLRYLDSLDGYRLAGDSL